jgi:predicted O-methyltransferase YrrM
MLRTKEHSAKSTDIHEHLPTLYSLVVESKAKAILELGVRTGESTVALLEAAQATNGHVTSLDIDPCLAAREMIGRYGLDSRWTFVHEDDLVWGAAWDKAKPWDFIFIDTSHLYEHTKKEIALFEPLLRPGGIMVFHDTTAFPQAVLVPIQEFLSGHPGFRFENRPNCNGLGILWKP